MKVEYMFLILVPICQSTSVLLDVGITPPDPDILSRLLSNPQLCPRNPSPLSNLFTEYVNRPFVHIESADINVLNSLLSDTESVNKNKDIYDEFDNFMTGMTKGPIVDLFKFLVKTAKLNIDSPADIIREIKPMNYEEIKPTMNDEEIKPTNQLTFEECIDRRDDLPSDFISSFINCQFKDDLHNTFYLNVNLFKTNIFEAHLSERKTMINAYKSCLFLNDLAGDREVILSVLDEGTSYEEEEQKNTQTCHCVIPIDKQSNNNIFRLIEGNLPLTNAESLSKIDSDNNNFFYGLDLFYSINIQDLFSKPKTTPPRKSKFDDIYNCVNNALLNKDECRKNDQIAFYSDLPYSSEHLLYVHTGSDINRKNHEIITSFLDLLIDPEKVTENLENYLDKTYALPCINKHRNIETIIRINHEFNRQYKLPKIDLISKSDYRSMKMSMNNEFVRLINFQNNIFNMIESEPFVKFLHISDTHVPEIHNNLFSKKGFFNEELKQFTISRNKLFNWDYSPKIEQTTLGKTFGKKHKVFVEEVSEKSEKEEKKDLEFDWHELHYHSEKSMFLSINLPIYNVEQQHLISRSYISFSSVKYPILKSILLSYSLLIVSISHGFISPPKIISTEYILGLKMASIIITIVENKMITKNVDKNTKPFENQKSSDIQRKSSDIQKCIEIPSSITHCQNGLKQIVSHNFYYAIKKRISLFKSSYYSLHSTEKGFNALSSNIDQYLSWFINILEKRPHFKPTNDYLGKIYLKSKTSFEVYDFKIENQLNLLLNFLLFRGLIYLYESTEFNEELPNLCLYSSSTDFIDICRDEYIDPSSFFGEVNIKMDNIDFLKFKLFLKSNFIHDRLPKFDNYIESLIGQLRRLSRFSFYSIFLHSQVNFFQNSNLEIFNIYYIISLFPIRSLLDLDRGKSSLSFNLFQSCQNFQFGIQPNIELKLWSFFNFYGNNRNFPVFFKIFSYAIYKSLIPMNFISSNYISDDYIYKILKTKQDSSNKDLQILYDWWSLSLSNLNVTECSGHDYFKLKYFMTRRILSTPVGLNHLFFGDIFSNNEEFIMKNILPYKLKLTFVYYGYGDFKNGGKNSLFTSIIREVKESFGNEYIFLNKLYNDYSHVDIINLESIDIYKILPQLLDELNNCEYGYIVDENNQIFKCFWSENDDEQHEPNVEKPINKNLKDFSFGSSDIDSEVSDPLDRLLIPKKELSSIPLVNLGIISNIDYDQLFYKHSGILSNFQYNFYNFRNLYFDYFIQNVEDGGSVEFSTSATVSSIQKYIATCKRFEKNDRVINTFKIGNSGDIVMLSEDSLSFLLEMRLIDIETELKNDDTFIEHMSDYINRPVDDYMRRIFGLYSMDGEFI